MPTTLTTLDSVLKNDYIGPIREQLNNSVPFLKRTKRRSAATAGKKMIIPLHKTRNTGIGARAEGGPLPTAGSQGYDDLQLNAAYLWGVVSFSQQSIEASRNDKGAFTRAITSEMKGLMRDLKRDCNREFYNDVYGTIATCGTTSASATVQLATTSNMNLFEVGMKIDIATKTTGTTITNGSNVGITAVDKSASTINVDGGVVTTASTHGVYRTGNYGNEITGLEAWVGTSDNTIGTIDRSSNDWFNPNILSNSGTLRALSLDLMQQAFDEAEIKSGGSVTVGYMYHSLRRKYLALVRADRRYVNEMSFDGGFKGVEFNSIPLIVDSYAPYNTIWFLDESNTKVYHLGPKDWSWMDKDGSVLSRTTTGGYDATMYWFPQYVVDVPGSCTALKDIQNS